MTVRKVPLAVAAGSVLLLLSIAAIWANENVLPVQSSAGTSPAPGPASGMIEGSADRPYRLFPSLLFTTVTREPGADATTGGVYGPENAPLPEPAEDPALRIPILANSTIVAFYGKPGSRKMGILGEYPKEKLAPLLEGYTKLYDTANGDKTAQSAFYLIFGTCWPGGDIGYLNRAVIEEYIQFALEKGILVFLDHQIGRFPVEASLKSMLPYLKYPNVHLALDPEWRTLKPMEEIGSVSAEEVNRAQKTMQEYMEGNDIPGIRMLVIHQFNSRMIQNRETVHSDFDRVLLVHTADGFGSPSLKKSAYAYNAKADNMPLKGFKLFFKGPVPGAGYDIPLMTPEEVLGLQPQPAVIMYQ